MPKWAPAMFYPGRHWSTLSSQSLGRRCDHRIVWTGCKPRLEDSRLITEQVWNLNLMKTKEYFPLFSPTMSNTHKSLTKHETNEVLSPLVDPVEGGVSGVQLDGGEHGLAGGRSGVGRVGSRSSNASVGHGSDGTDGPLAPACDPVAEGVRHVADGVVAGLVPEGVGSSHSTAVTSAPLLSGVVDVLVAVGSVTGLVLGAVLAGGGLGGDGGQGSGHRGSVGHRGSGLNYGSHGLNYGRPGVGNWGSSIGYRSTDGSSIGSGVAMSTISTISEAVSTVSVVSISFGLGCDNHQEGGEDGLQVWSGGKGRSFRKGGEIVDATYKALH